MKAKHTLLALVALLSALPIAAMAQPNVPIQNMRPYDQRGLHVFESPKSTADSAASDEFAFKWGVGFTQSFQGLTHESGATARMMDPDKAPNSGDEYNANQLMEVGTGFNLATANLNLDAQLARGIRLNVVSYLSSRHHQETWVKGGYIQVDGSPINTPVLNKLFEFATLKVGHFENNYGDAHFRRTDNGNALYNPFVENYLMDAFTTEIGGELYLRHKGFLAMAGVSNGESNGMVNRPNDRSFAQYGKLGFDTQFSRDLHARLTGSVYRNDKAANTVLYGGDRGGSQYYLIMENMKATTKDNFTSGRINPAFGNEITAFVINPFVKFRGLELFGVIEQASGHRIGEERRTWTQLGAEAVYRFLPREQAFVGARYNTAGGETNFGTTAVPVIREVSADRVQVGAGWFVTPQILLKGEYVNQSYNDYPEASILHKGRFNGFVIQGVVGF